MIRIGICDDSEKDRNIVQGLCEKNLDNSKIEREYILFTSGEEVIDYCEEKDNQRIDILFLDVEMSGISGIEVKEKILKYDNVWRIVFVSGYEENVWGAIGLKTLGFIVKPAGQEVINKWLNIVMEELKEEVFIEIKGISDGCGKIIRFEDIEYFKADGNYTEIFLHSARKDCKSILVTKKLVDLKREIDNELIIRVHKSYMVNLVNIVGMENDISLRDINEKIPIGRAYKEHAKKRYFEYGRDKVFKRL